MTEVALRERTLGAPEPPRPIAPVEEWKPSFNPWLVAASVMLATFMEVLDTSVANVALPHIAGSLSATTDEATWVLSSYLVANAIVLPATGWLGRRYGRKRFLLTCIVIFTLASFLSGAATSLGFLVFARVLQGAGGGALQPIAQAVLLESFPMEKRGQAMAIYGMGIVVAPILGPTLGGWITDNFSWRWIFYINLPVGIAAILMGRKYIEDPPYIKNVTRSIDYIGFALMTIWLGCLAHVFAKGEEADWFQSTDIVAMTVISGAAALAFIVWELSVENPIVNLRVFKNRNFATGTFLIVIVGVILYGTTALLPLLLQTLMGYPAMQSGMAVSPRGLGAIVSMMLVGRLIGKVDSRLMVGGGFFGLALASYAFGKLTLNVSLLSVALPNVFTGFCVGFIFVPLTTLTTAALPAEEIGNATGIYNLMRNIGGSLGISMLDTMLNRGSQAHQAMMVAHMSPDSPLFVRHLAGMQGALATHLGVGAKTAGYQMMYRLLAEQASFASYIDNFRIMAVMALCCVPLALLFRPRKGASGAMVH